MYKRILPWSLPCLFVALVLSPGQTQPPVPTPEQSLSKASVNGKYRMLLRQFKAEQDVKEFQEFKDVGMQQKTEYAGLSDLPKGYWVYVYPYWYIWRDLAATPLPSRAWGPEQACGEPNTEGSGDIQTAWASASQDDQDEWLLLEYAEPTMPTTILVYETYNPGALTRVTAFNLQGDEVELWKGVDPTPQDSERGVSEIPVKANFKTNRIKIYLASKSVPGWNEIDAVGLRDKNRTQWAVACDASSTYAQAVAARPAFIPVEEDRIRRLEEEVRQLKMQMEELKKLLKKDK